MLALRPFHRYFDFAGRSGRAEYWQYVALTIAINWIASTVDAIALGGVATMTAALLTTVPSLAVMTRRLHDRNLSGWYAGAAGLLLALAYLMGGEGGGVLGQAKVWIVTIALFGMLGYVIIQTAQPGDPDANDYGAPDDPAITPPLHPVFEYFRAPPRPIAPVPHEDVASAIERLGKLRDQGLLSEEEFAAEKRKLLSPAATPQSN